MMSGKVKTFSKQKGICKGYFLSWGFCISNFKAIAHAIDRQSGTCRRYLLLQGLYVPSVKTAKYICNRFNTSFCTKDHKTHLAISCYILLHQTAPGCTRLLTPPCPPRFSLALYYEHIVSKSFSSKFVSRIPSVLSSFLHAIWSALSSPFKSLKQWNNLVHI